MLHYKQNLPFFLFAILFQQYLILKQAELTPAFFVSILNL